MSSWTAPKDVLDRWIGSDKPELDDGTLQTLILDAEDAILEAFPRIQERIDADTLPIRRVQRVVSSVVIRAWKAGQEFRSSFSETTGPFSHSGSFNSSNAGKFITLTEDEINTLSPTKGKKAMEISMAPNSHSGRRWRCE